MNLADLIGALNLAGPNFNFDLAGRDPNVNLAGWNGALNLAGPKKNYTINLPLNPLAP